MKSLSLNKPHLIIMVGIPGSGKTFFAEHFSDTFKAPFINVNHLRENLFGNTESNNDEVAIAQKASQYMLDNMLKTNKTIIYEGRTDLRSERAVLAKKARDAGYESLFVWVQTEPTTAKRRAGKSTDNKLSADEFNNSLKRFRPPHASEKAIVISGKHTYPSQLKIALIRLAGNRPAPKAQPITTNIPAIPVRTPMNRNILIR